MKKNPKAKSLTLRQLYSCLGQCVVKAGSLDPDVEVWIGEKLYRVVRVGQFGVMPDVTLELREEVE